MKSGIRKIATYLPLIVLGSVAFLALTLIQRSKGDDAFFFNLATSTHLFSIFFMHGRRHALWQDAH